jgi:hypothetical protein
VRYRVYVDEELLTERDFIWDGLEFFIREHILVELEPGPHKLYIEEIPSGQRISIKNVTVDGTRCDPYFTIDQ